MAAKEILIAGGGPAGALCAERLAQAGFRVTLFEERYRDGAHWEKPCGGGITWKTLDRYPFLLDGGVDKKLIRTAELIAPDGFRAHLELTRPLALFSRVRLNRFLLERAEAAGCTVVPARVIEAHATATGVLLHTTQDDFRGNFLVIATGARNALRVENDGWRSTPRDMELTLGYYLPVQDDVLRVKFLENFEGYLWSFPRVDHLSVGICGKMEQNTAASLRKKLDRFVAASGLPTRGARLYSHLLPSLAWPSWEQLPLAGSGWARVGDAAGLVDPVTGEGIYYALRSGELLAETLLAPPRAGLAGEPVAYAGRVEEDFAADLRRAARWQRYFYRGGLLGAGVTQRMVQLVACSPRFAALVDDLFAGTQRYRQLKGRLARIAVPVALEALTADARGAAATGPSGRRLAEIHGAGRRPRQQRGWAEP